MFVICRLFYTQEILVNSGNNWLKFDFIIKIFIWQFVIEMFGKIDLLRHGSFIFYTFIITFSAWMLISAYNSACSIKYLIYTKFYYSIRYSHSTTLYMSYSTKCQWDFSLKLNLKNVSRVCDSTHYTSKQILSKQSHEYRLSIVSTLAADTLPTRPGE